MVVVVVVVVVVVKVVIVAVVVLNNCLSEPLLGIKSGSHINKKKTVYTTQW